VDDRYAKSMERAERVLRNMSTRTPEARAAMQRTRQRRNREAGKRAKRVLAALLAIFVGAFLWGLVLAPLGVTGVMLVVALAIMSAIILGIFPRSRQEATAVDALSSAELVHRLDTRLIRERAALPAPALTQIDAISAQLPLLEKRLETLDPLDPLAQDARRLMGQHLPDLLDRYEKVPAAYRKQQDGGGLTVEDRLLSGLGAARTAIDDLGEKLAREDLNAFETQGRFIESRYREGDLSQG
jgi:hypothetical protein